MVDNGNELIMLSFIVIGKRQDMKVSTRRPLTL